MARTRSNNNLSLLLKCVFYILLLSIGFCLGVLSSLGTCPSPLQSSNIKDLDMKKQAIEENENSKLVFNRQVEALVEERLKVLMSDVSHNNIEQPKKQQQADKQQSNDNNKTSRFSNEMGSFMAGMARMTKKDFLDQFDYGTADNHGDANGEREVLVLYNRGSAVPSSNSHIASMIQYDDSSPIPLLTPDQATENCDELNVIHLSTSGSRQCTAILGSFPSYHLHRWMRSGDREKHGHQKLDSSLPLRHVGRGLQDNGMNKFEAPNVNETKRQWKKLHLYLQEFERVSSEVEAIIKKIHKNNTIIVLVCNHGQSPLLVNFACNSKSQGFETSNILVFATDLETKDMAEALGMTVYYDEALFSDLPSKEAGNYGDGTFSAMMMAKVWSVHLVNWLGYDVLFQDVDVVWMKDPISFFHDKNSKFYDYDMLFQDDGARSTRYAPYCANSGFYYVRANDRTRWVLTQLLYQGDFIKKTGSHQQALSALLSEHTSLQGLKVKTLDWEFPGGWHYHRQRGHMKAIAEKKEFPYIFHMSWTANKDNKLLFFQQMGMWYVQKQCDAQHDAVKLLQEGKSSGQDFAELCCTKEPRVECHYKDKPSIIPCNDSPPIDRGGRSFW